MVIPRPLDMERLVRCLERDYGAVDLFVEGGLTKLRVGGVPLTFLDAERLCLGEVTIDELKAKVHK